MSGGDLLLGMVGSGAADLTPAWDTLARAALRNAYLTCADALPFTGPQNQAAAAPAATPHADEHYIPVSRDALGFPVTESPKRVRGLYQVNLFVKAGGGTHLIDQVVESVLAQYPQGGALFYTVGDRTVAVTVDRAERDAGREDGKGFWMVPVKVQFHYTEPPPP